MDHKKLKEIAGLAANEIKDGDRIMLDASPVSAHLAHELKDKKNLTIITNSVEIVFGLQGKKGWTILLAGGALEKGVNALVGPQTDRVLSSLKADKTIISCEGIDIDAGLTEGYGYYAQNKRTMLLAAEERILAADSSRFEKTAFTEIGRLKDIDKIVTDKRPGKQWLGICSELGIECIYPGGENVT